MERIILIISFILCSFFANAQINSQRSDIVKYDFSTYKGIPIQKGWLFDDITYKKLYTSYTAADSLIQTFENYKRMRDKLDSANQKIIVTQELRIADKDKIIAGLEKDSKDLDDLLKKSNDNVEKLQKQFITIGKIKIHKGTAIKVGLAFGAMGYLVGKL
jgi:hypothetical protein